MENGTDKTRFEYGLDKQSQIQHMRSVEGRSGGQRTDHKLHNNVIILFGSTAHRSHVGLTYDHKSMADGGLIAGGIGFGRDDKTCFCTAVDPTNVSMLRPRYLPNEPWNVPYELRWRRIHNAVFGIDLKSAKNKGLVFWQTITNAIILYDSMPAGCVVRVVRRSVDDTEAKILYEKAEPDQRKPPHISFTENPKLRFEPWEILCGKERISLRLKCSE